MKQLRLGPSLDQLVQRSVMLLQANAPPDGSPLYVCFSGGKDSVVIKELVRLSGVPATYHYNVIIDPPELMRFIRDVHPDVIWERSRHGDFFRRVVAKRMLPTRFRRWCCAEYKHTLGPKKCVRVLGVRVDESGARSKRYTSCTMHRPAGRKEVYPIRLWSDDHVWQFIRSRNLPYCSLYDEGFTRLGCVMCPLSSVGNRKREAERWPRYREKWERAAILVFNERKRLGMTQFPRQPERERERERESGPRRERQRTICSVDDGSVTGKDLYRWWIENA